MARFRSGKKQTDEAEGQGPERGRSSRARDDRGETPPEPETVSASKPNPLTALMQRLGDGDGEQQPAAAPDDDAVETRSAKDREKEPRMRRGAGKRKPGAKRRGGADLKTRAATAKQMGLRILAPIEGAFVALLAILGAVLTGIWAALIAVYRVLAPPARAVGRRLHAWMTAASRFLTPARGLLLAALGCAVLLGLSQFADYRGISIGADAYEPGISSVAPAPEVEREELGTAHSYAMIPVALLAIALLAFAARSGRWQLCRLVVVLGLAAIVVAIVVDRPAGLDEGNLNRDFTGVEAKLLGGYWMQLFAGAGLALTALLLGNELKREATAGGRARKGSKGANGSKGSRKDRRREGRRRRLGRAGSGTTGAAEAEGAGA